MRKDIVAVVKATPHDGDREDLAEAINALYPKPVLKLCTLRGEWSVRESYGRRHYPNGFCAAYEKGGVVNTVFTGPNTNTPTIGDTCRILTENALEEEGLGRHVHSGNRNTISVVAGTTITATASLSTTLAVFLAPFVAVTAAAGIKAGKWLDQRRLLYLPEEAEHFVYGREAETSIMRSYVEMLSNRARLLSRVKPWQE